jgi:hypothetical protein
MESLNLTAFSIAEIMLLEQIAREHPKEIQIARTNKDDTKPTLKVTTLNKDYQGYVFFLLKRLRAHQETLDALYALDSWNYT